MKVGKVGLMNKIGSASLLGGVITLLTPLGIVGGAVMGGAIVIGLGAMLRKPKEDTPDTVYKTTFYDGGKQTEVYKKKK